jgi:hypothetical protein
MHGVDRLTSEPRERILVAHVEVLEVELDAVEPVVATERGERAERLRTRRRVGEHAMNGRLVEARVHHEWHELHALRSRGLDHARVDLSDNDPGRIHRVDLRRDNRDLVGVFQKRPDALLAAQIPQRLETLGMGVNAGQAGQRERGDRAANRSEPESHRTAVAHH